MLIIVYYSDISVITRMRETERALLVMTKNLQRTAAETGSGSAIYFRPQLLVGLGLMKKIFIYHKYIIYHIHF